MNKSIFAQISKKEKQNNFHVKYAYFQNEMKFYFQQKFNASTQYKALSWEFLKESLYNSSFIKMKEKEPIVLQQKYSPTHALVIINKVVFVSNHSCHRVSQTPSRQEHQSDKNIKQSDIKQKRFWRTKVRIPPLLQRREYHPVRIPYSPDKLFGQHSLKEILSKVKSHLDRLETNQQERKRNDKSSLSPLVFLRNPWTSNDSLPSQPDATHSK